MKTQKIGVDLGGTKLLILCDEIEEIFSTGISFTPEELISHLQSFIFKHGINPHSISLAVPGLVNEFGHIVNCDVLPAFIGWQGNDALKLLCSKTIILNDVKAAMHAELNDSTSHAASGIIMIGTGIGAAFIINGKPLLGANGWAGELGYLPVKSNEGIKRLDEVASGSAITKQCALSPSNLALMANNGDQPTLTVIKEAGTALGLGIATVINLLNPSQLVIGGGTIELPGYLDAALKSAKENSLPELWQDCDISKVKAGRKVAALGAIRAIEQ
ncbi:ROK family protein [Acinetobacter pittii]|uniref:ROK family protein n=1 Tax=Acinetobacter calcoaceticus/baumannii complex TaxID=909768 RepID=UPI001EFDDE78|nr:MULTISPECIES: ROK family protein [Acinetobacter calcoaceticus/baumannii complex]MCG9491752.1 ROK family protein [Acinetobacter pittii]MCU4347219.1 ROK family protein [Acinetobacter lactucae]